MNKEAWVRPETMVQQFAANEYVAACGESGVTYNFKCDAPSGGAVYYYPNGRGGSVEEAAGYSWFLGSQYHPCGDTHEAESSNAFYDGFIDRNHNEQEDYGEAVIVWLGKSGNNCHCTTNLDINSWGHARS